MPGARPTLLTRRATLSLAATLAAGPARAAAKRLSLAVPRDIQGPLDPAYRLGAVEANILRAVCPGLVANDEEGRIVQALAQTITTQSDTAIAFTLREGLEFHDGFGPVTAADVKFSFERFRRPGPDDALPPYAADWAVLDGVELTGPLSGILHLRAPSPMLWRTVLPDASGSIISRHALEEGLYRPRANGLHAPGAGHWRVGDWLPHQHLMLHSTAASTAFESIILRPVEQAKTAELAVRAGEVAFAAVPPEDLDSLRRVPGQAVIDRPADNLVWLGVNALAPPFDDARVRQAVGLSLDIDLLVQGAWNGAVPRAFAAVAPGLPGYWQDAPRLKRDIPRARALLQQAGHGDGLAAKLLVMNQPAHQRAGVIAQAMLRDAGIHVSLDIRDPGAFWSAGNGAAGRELQLVLQRFGGKPDPGFLLQWFTTSQIGGWNWQGFRDAEYDRLVIQAAATPDGPAREAIYQDAQRRMADSFCFVFLTHEVASCVYRDWLRPAVLRNGEDWLLDRFVRA